MHQKFFLVISYSKIAPTSAASSTFSYDQRPHSIPTCPILSLQYTGEQIQSVKLLSFSLSLWLPLSFLCKGLQCTYHNDKMHPVYGEGKIYLSTFSMGRKGGKKREYILKHFRLWLLQIRKCTLLPQMEYRQLHCESAISVPFASQSY